MKPAPSRQKPATSMVACILFFDPNDELRTVPVIMTDRDALELARRLQQLARDLIEHPSLAGRLAGCM